MGEEEKIQRRLYVHVFRNLANVTKEELNLRKDLYELQQQLMEGETEFKLSAQEKIDTFLIQSRLGRGGQLKVTFNDQAINKVKKQYGYFVLVSNEKMDCFEALEHYRLREKIEELFAIQKHSLDGRRPRTWYSDNLRGRQFVQFVGLGYYCFLMKRIKQVRENLCVDKTLTDKEWQLEDSLRHWLDKHSLIQILDWFDCVEQVTVDDKRWTTETTLRDQLFLRKLGVDL